MISEHARAKSASARSHPGAPPPEGVTLRRVETLAEYQACLAIQQEIWGAGFRELVPPTILLVAQKLGGVCAGAFTPNGRMLGFVFGMTGLRDGRLAHWSDMLAVRGEARGAHLGERLKHYQRELVRAIGVETMYWTFDPLVARNAHLNLDRLGARVVEYVSDMYGRDTGSPLHGSLATDRLVVAWDLTGADAARRDPPPPGVLVNPPGANGLPAFGGMPDAPVVRIAIPRDAEAESVERRAIWRDVTRDAFVGYLDRGYQVIGFRRGTGDEPACYDLSRGSE